MTLADMPLTVTFDPAPPWSVPALGLPAFLAVALVLIGLTLWTYRGVRGAGPRRVMVLVGLRLAALAVTFLIVLRPSFAARDDVNVPSVLLLVADHSESMSVRDQHNNQSRWDYLNQLLKESEPHLAKLRDEHRIAVKTYRFAGDVQEFGPDPRADGKRTDFGQMLHQLLERHGGERHLRGLMILSDGADHGTRHPPTTVAARWRALPCPVTTFAFGRTTTTSSQRDVRFTSINPDPSPVAVKGKLNVRAVVEAPGFENARVRVRLLLNDQEVAAKDETLAQSAGNEIAVPADAPATPGEVKVTLKIDPVDGEVSPGNNEISTYVTVTKEGLSVLYVEGKDRVESAFIRRALARDPRIRLYYSVRVSDDAPQGEEADWFQFDKQHYDAVIIGDVSPQRLAAGNAQTLDKVNELVSQRGTGLLMLGGVETFANPAWANTPVGKMLPVELDVYEQTPGPVRMVPTPDGLRHYLLRLGAGEAETKARWDQVRPFTDGVTRLGKPKPNALVLAETDAKNPLLVGALAYGKGRTLAFGADETWRWIRSHADLELQNRFWKQVVLWLAQQEEAEGNAWIRPDVRRLAAGGKLGFAVGLRGKGGIELPNARFDLRLVGPDGAESPLPVSPNESGEQRGTFWKTDAPGEYRLVVRAEGAEADGKPATGEANARFLVYQDDVEMLRTAADHKFLETLAQAGGGQSFMADELPEFLKTLTAQPLPQVKPKTRLWPDWRRAPASAALGDQLGTLASSGILACFVLFVACLAAEWVLRRYWGLV